MATRTVTRFMAFFDDAGNLTRLGAAGRIDTDDDYTDPDNFVRKVQTEVWYSVKRSQLPTGFVADMEAIHAKIVTKLDEAYPV